MPPPHPLLAQAVDAARAGRRDEAIALLQGLLGDEPGHETALHHLAQLLRHAGRAEQALAPLRRLAALRPEHAGAHVQLGHALRGLGRAREAEAELRRASRLLPGDTDIGKALGSLLFTQGRMAEAEQAFRLALSGAPGDEELWYNLAIARKRRGRPGEAIPALRRACRLAPASAPPLRELANLLMANNRGGEARPVLERLLDLAPDDAQALLYLAGLRKADGDKAGAVALLERAAAGQTGLTSTTLGLCMARLPMMYRDEADMAATRADYAADLERLAAADLSDPAALDRAAQAACTFQPYYLPYQARCDRDLQETYGRLMHRAMAARHPGWATPPEVAPPAPGEPVRVGIVSGFFRWHTIWKLFLRGWMEGLDRRRLNITAYSTTTVRDEVAAVARAGFPRFVEGLDIPALAERIRADRNHVLLWPEVGMDHAAAKLACLRLAPVQCVSWGHPDTTGLPSMDWFLTSDLMEPEGGEACYSERVLRLPGLGIRYDALAVTARPTDFAAFGLRPDALVYLCCQYLPKYLPRHDRLLARIAAQVPGAQFAFISLRKPALDAVLRDRLAAAFAAEGLDARDHVVLLPYLEPGQYAALNQRADVYLDTIGWSGGNTTFEAVAAGLPVVTLPGELMRGRHSAAILRQIGVTETIARDEDDYVDIAARLGRDDAWRQAVGRRVADGQRHIHADQAPLRALEDFLERVSRAEGSPRSS